MSEILLKIFGCLIVALFITYYISIVADYFKEVKDILKQIEENTKNK